MVRLPFVKSVSSPDHDDSILASCFSIFRKMKRAFVRSSCTLPRSICFFRVFFFLNRSILSTRREKRTITGRNPLLFEGRRWAMEMSFLSTAAPISPARVTTSFDHKIPTFFRHCVPSFLLVNQRFAGFHFDYTAQLTMPPIVFSDYSFSQNKPFLLEVHWRSPTSTFWLIPPQYFG